jgi:hypothetical protein
MIASSVEHGPRDCSRKSVRAIRDLSPSIARKREFLAVNLKVSPARPDKKAINVRRLYVPETIEWE